MDKTLCVCDTKVGHCAINGLTGISKVVDLRSGDVNKVRQLETSINFE